MAFLMDAANDMIANSTDFISSIMDGLWTELFSVLVSGFTLYLMLTGTPPALLVVLMVIFCITMMSISTWQWFNEEHRSPPIFFLAFIATVIMAGCSLFIGAHYVGDKSTFTGIITDKRWHYEWDVEQWSAYNTSCWGRGCQSSTAYNKKEAYEDTGRTLKVGESCSTYTDSDGKEHESCTDITVPIYDWHEYYMDNGWLKARTEVSSGSQSTKTKMSDIESLPHWPQLDLHRPYDSSSCRTTLTSVGQYAELLGCQRPSTQRAYYYYTFHIQHPIDQTKECDLVPFLEAYTNIKIEQTITGEYWSHQFIADCSATKF